MYWLQFLKQNFNFNPLLQSAPIPFLPGVASCRLFLHIASFLWDNRFSAVSFPIKTPVVFKFCTRLSTHPSPLCWSVFMCVRQCRADAECGQHFVSPLCLACRYHFCPRCLYYVRDVYVCVRLLPCGCMLVLSIPFVLLPSFCCCLIFPAISPLVPLIVRSLTNKTWKDT